MFGFNNLGFGCMGGGRGYGRRRRKGWRIIMKTKEIEDPDRLLFGFGPCGEIAYQFYKKEKERNLKEKKDSSN